MNSSLVSVNIIVGILYVAHKLVAIEPTIPSALDTLATNAKSVNAGGSIEAVATLVCALRSSFNESISLNVLVNSSVSEPSMNFIATSMLPILPQLFICGPNPNAISFGLSPAPLFISAK